MLCLNESWGWIHIPRNLRRSDRWKILAKYYNRSRSCRAVGSIVWFLEIYWIAKWHWSFQGGNIIFYFVYRIAFDLTTDLIVFWWLMEGWCMYNFTDCYRAISVSSYLFPFGNAFSTVNHFKPFMTRHKVMTKMHFFQNRCFVLLF